MVYTFAFLLFFILLAQFGAAIAAFVLEINPGEVIKINMEIGLDNYGANDHQGITNTLDTVQEQLECCGVSNFTDWRQTSMFSDGGVPDSCCKVGLFLTFTGLKTLYCKNEVALCGHPGYEERAIYTRGCLELVNSVFVDNMSVIGGKNS